MRRHARGPCSDGGVWSERERGGSALVLLRGGRKHKHLIKWLMLFLALPLICSVVSATVIGTPFASNSPL